MKSADATDPAASIRAHLAARPPPDAAAGLRALVGAGLDRLPLPGGSATLARWRALAEVAAHDLALVKLYEGHTDALAILAELGMPARAGALWATWAAEPPQAKLVLRAGSRGSVVNGRKAWCSGAAAVDRALVTAWDERGRQCLVAVALSGEGVRITDDGWHAVGMAAPRPARPAAR